MPPTIRLDADGVQPDVVDAWAPARGDEQPVTAQLAAIRELEHEILAIPASCGCLDSKAQLHAIAAQDIAERVAKRGGFSGDHAGAALGQRHLTAQASYSLG